MWMTVPTPVEIGTMRNYTPTEEQRDYMADLAKAFTNSMDQRSNKLRDWYNRGQEAFRHALQSVAGLEPSAEQLHSHLEQIEESAQREGFLMGWRSDEWAYQNNKQFSIIGGIHVTVEDISNAE